MKKTTTRTTVIVVLLVLAVVGYYAYLSNRSRENREEAAMTVVQATLSRDLGKDYPPTPKEVIKYYNEILRCLYNEESSDEEIEALGDKARELYDADLLAINERESYQLKLQAEVYDYRDQKRRITSFNVASSTSVDFFEADGFEFAKIMCGYNVLQDGKNYPSSQMFLLRKDADKRWKIYGWDNVENLEVQDE